MRYRRWPGHVTFFASPKKVTKERRPRGSPIAGQVKNRNEQSVGQDSPRGSAVPVVQSEPSPAKTRPCSSPTFTRRIRMRAHVSLFCLRFAMSNVPGARMFDSPGICNEQLAWCTYLQPPGEGKRRAGMGSYPGLALTETRGRRSRDHQSWCHRRFVSVLDLPRDWRAPRSPFFGYFLVLDSVDTF